MTIEIQSTREYIIHFKKMSIITNRSISSTSEKIIIHIIMNP